jgi:putative tricarboxylic transport membrane protein
MFESIDLAIMLQGLTNLFTITNLGWLFLGVALGLFAGTIPGFSGVSMIAIMLPFAVRLGVDTMLITMAGIYAAGIYSGSTSGIFYNIPGDAAGIPATIEGYKLTQKGRTSDALAAALGGSFCGGLIGFVLLVILVPVFMHFISFFGTAERALFALWAMILVSSGVVTKDDPFKGLASVGLGLALGMIGQQPNIGTFRFTMGLDHLWNGIDLVWVILGVFAVPQIVKMIDMINLNRDQSVNLEKVTFWGMYKRIFGIIRKGIGIISISSLYGSIIGIIPGVGAVTASWVGYAAARNKSKNPEEFNHGALDGVLGAETANNAAATAAFIPLFGIGIPGSGAAAIMLGALILVGVFPGPSMMANHGLEIWTVLFGIGFSCVAFMILAYPFIKFAESITKLPIPAFIGVIGILSVMGSYLTNFSIFGPLAMLILGIFVLFANNIGLVPAPIIIGFVLGPAIEMEVIRAYQIGGFGRFLEPTTLVILVIVVLTLVLGLYQSFKRNKVENETVSLELSDLRLNFIKEKVYAVLLVILTAAMFITSRDFPHLARIWVDMVLIFFLGAPAIIMLVKNINKLPQIVTWLKEGGFSEIRSGIVYKKLFDIFMVIVFFLVFLILFNPMGFVVSAAIFVFGLSVYFARNLKKALIYSLFIGCLVFLLKTGLGFYMPRGIFGI